MNALFLKDLALKTRRGIEGRVRTGHSGGGNAYGYDVVREIDGHGDAVRGGRRISEVEAAIVRRISTEFAAGKSPRAISRALNTEGILGPRSRPWGDTIIRGHALRRTGILHNELYVGRLVWNKQRYVKDPKTGKRLARLNLESDWIVQEVPELRIVDQALWDRAQARLRDIRESPRVTKARKTRFWEKRRVRHLITGLAKCGNCGGALSAVGRDYLACPRIFEICRRYVDYKFGRHQAVHGDRRLGCCRPELARISDRRSRAVWGIGDTGWNQNQMGRRGSCGLSRRRNSSWSPVLGDGGPGARRQ